MSVSCLMSDADAVLSLVSLTSQGMKGIKANLKFWEIHYHRGKESYFAFNQILHERGTFECNSTIVYNDCFV